MREPELHEEVFHVEYGKGIVTQVSGELLTVYFKGSGYLPFHILKDRLDFFLRGDLLFFQAGGLYGTEKENGERDQSDASAPTGYSGFDP